MNRRVNLKYDAEAGSENWTGSTDGRRRRHVSVTGNRDTYIARLSQSAQSAKKKKKNRGTLKRSAKNRADGKKLRQQSEQQEQLLRQSKRRRWRTRGNKKLLGPGRTHTSW